MTTTESMPHEAVPKGRQSAVAREPLLLPAHHAAAVCGTSARTWRAWDVAGKIPAPIRIGRRTFWRAEDLRDWVAAGCPDRLTWEALRE
jgi:predicted DNA-binding transcriptional regulator AlpA